MSFEMPVDAVGLDWKLPPQRVQDCCKIGSILPISLSCVSVLWASAKRYLLMGAPFLSLSLSLFVLAQVYTPFQFWFHILTSQYAKSPVAQMTTGLE